MMIFPIAALALLWLLLSRTRTANRLIRTIGADLPAKLLPVVLVFAALLVLARGNVWAALCLFGLSLWSLGRGTRSNKPRHADISRARSRLIAMDYDAASGRMSGVVIAGPQAGTPLDALGREQCEALYAACLQGDPGGARLLETYLDRRFPGWRLAADADMDAGAGRARFTSRMTEEEAYQILGLRHGASREDIVRSHRTAMKKWHPDQGGTADLAARANEAKEVLLRRHA